MKAHHQHPRNTPRNIAHQADHAGTSPNRYSDVEPKSNTIKSKIMSNKKVIIGVAAGVAALAVTAIILKRKGYLDGIADKATDFGKKLKNRYNDTKEDAHKKIDDIVSKSNQIADKAASEIKSATA